MSAMSAAVAPVKVARAARAGKAARGQARRSAARAVQVPVKAAATDEVEVEVSPRDTRSVVAVVLGGGAGTRLYPLTKLRAKPAVPVGGAYRLIDIPMSNCINSGINKAYVLTQFNSTSLNRHLSRTYGGASSNAFGGDGFVEVLAAAQGPSAGGKEWFQGTADAVRQYLWLFEDNKNKSCNDLIILSGDHLYRMDYMDFVAKHRESGADITISCLPMDDSRAADFGLMKIDDTGRVVAFAEKPKGDELKAMQVDTTILGLDPAEAKEKPYIASMGIYVFKKDALLKLLSFRFPDANDFGSEVIPQAKDEYKIQAYLFNDYWEDIGTMRSFFDANLALTNVPAQFEFYDADRPIYTSPRFLPPSNVVDCTLTGGSIISHGCNLDRCTVDHSVIGLRSRIGEGAVIEDSLIIGADYYETDAERAALVAEGKVPIGVGAGSTVKGAILDKNARIGRDCKIINVEGVEEAAHEEDGWFVRSGVLTILRNGTIPDGTVI